MAQLLRDGVAICRWCKEPLNDVSRTRPAEVHPQHARVRRVALNSGRWTVAMDHAVTLEEVEHFKAAQASAAYASLTPELWNLQLALNAVTANGDNLLLQPVVADLATAAARLLHGMQGGPVVLRNEEIEEPTATSLRRRRQAS